MKRMMLLVMFCEKTIVVEDTNDIIIKRTKIIRPPHKSILNPLNQTI